MILLILLLCGTYICSGYDIRGTYSWSPRGTYEGKEDDPLTVRCYFSESEQNLPIYAVLLKEQVNSYGLFSTEGSPFGPPQITRNGNRGKIFWNTQSASLDASGNYSCVISQYPQSKDPNRDPGSHAVTMTFADFEVKIYPKTDTEEPEKMEENTKFEVEVREDPVVGYLEDPLAIECFYRGAHPDAQLTAELKKEPDSSTTEDVGARAPTFTGPKYSASIDGTGKVTWKAKSILLSDAGTYSCSIIQDYTNSETGEKESEAAKTTFTLTVTEEPDSDEYLELIDDEEEDEHDHEHENEEENTDDQDEQKSPDDEHDEGDENAASYRRRRSTFIDKIRSRRSTFIDKVRSRK